MAEKDPPISSPPPRSQSSSASATLPCSITLSPIQSPPQHTAFSSGRSKPIGKLISPSNDTDQELSQDDEESHSDSHPESRLLIDNNKSKSLPKSVLLNSQAPYQPHKFDNDNNRCPNENMLDDEKDEENEEKTKK